MNLISLRTTLEADNIWDGNVKIDPLLKSVSDAVYKRAEEDAFALLEYLKDSMQGSADGLRINNWRWPRYEWPWEVYSDIFSGSKGRRKRIGWAGLHIGYGKEGFRLIGLVKPRIGGLDGQRKLAVGLQKEDEASPSHKERSEKVSRLERLRHLAG